jgi:hypothetical protein
MGKFFYICRIHFCAVLLNPRRGSGITAKRSRSQIIFNSISQLDVGNETLIPVLLILSAKEQF